MLGQIQTGKIIDENTTAYFVQVKGVTFECKKQELTQEERPQIGQEFSGFCYENQHHQMMMTQFMPFAQADQYGWGKVTEVQSGLGVFVDVGLADKDMVLSIDDLPFERNKWPKKDDRLLVRLETDEKNRIWCKLADETVFDQLATNFPSNLANRDLVMTVYGSREIGAFGITNEFYRAFIHQSQSLRPLRLGEQVKARVIGASQYGRLNLSALPRAFEQIDEDAQMILMSLRRKADKTLPFSDKSDAAAIKQYFGISKGAFKRALGHLLKAKYLREDKEAGTIALVADPETDHE